MKVCDYAWSEEGIDNEHLTLELSKVFVGEGFAQDIAKSIRMISDVCTKPLDDEHISSIEAAAQAIEREEKHDKIIARFLCTSYGMNKMSAIQGHIANQIANNQQLASLNALQEETLRVLRDAPSMPRQVLLMNLKKVSTTLASIVSVAKDDFKTKNKIAIDQVIGMLASARSSLCVSEIVKARKLISGAVQIVLADFPEADAAQVVKDPESSSVQVVEQVEKVIEEGLRGLGDAEKLGLTKLGGEDEVKEWNEKREPIKACMLAIVKLAAMIFFEDAGVAAKFPMDAPTFCDMSKWIDILAPDPQKFFNWELDLSIETSLPDDDAFLVRFIKVAQGAVLRFFQQPMNALKMKAFHFYRG